MSALGTVKHTAPIGVHRPHQHAPSHRHVPSHRSCFRLVDYKLHACLSAFLDVGQSAQCSAGLGTQICLFVTVKRKASSCNCNTITIEREIMDCFFHACGFSIPDNSIFICFHWEFKVTESNQMEVYRFVYAECQKPP